MNDYEVVLPNGDSVLIQSERMAVKSDGALVFYNYRGSMSEQYLYGSEVVATFQPNMYAYFTKGKGKLL